MRTVTAMTKTNNTISKAAVLSALNGLTEIYLNNLPPTIYKADAVEAVKALPSAQPEPEEFEWCHTCREYDQEKHCCHRWTKVIRKTVDDMKAAQPGWIPCTPKTMPKMTDIYLVKVRINQYGEGMYPTFRTALWHTASRKWFVHESENSIIGEVTEWMPIPWEGGQE